MTTWVIRNLGLRYAAALIAGHLMLVMALAAKAEDCDAGISLSPEQSSRLSQLPPEMLEILRVLRTNRAAFCRQSQSAVLQDEPADPLSETPGSQTEQAPSDPYRPDEVIATVPGDGGNIPQIASTHGLTLRETRRSGLLNAFVARFGITDGRSVTQVLSALAGDSRVSVSAPQHIYGLNGDDDDIEIARFAPKMIALNSMANSVGGRNIKIAVIDTAVDEKHPSLAGAILGQFNAFVEQPIVNRRHGTSVAGLIAGRRMLRGIAPGASLLVARAFDAGKGKHPNAVVSGLISSLDWAIEQGARIVNMSFTGPRNEVLSRILAAAAKRGAILIAAAGNNGPSAPAAYPGAEPGVLAVTAIDADKRIYKNANQGPYVFIAAPGVDVLAPTPGLGIDIVSGTSFAAPFISGVAALLLEKYPGLSSQDVVRKLEVTAQDLGARGRDTVFGVGLVNADKALQSGPSTNMRN